MSGNKMSITCDQKIDLYKFKSIFERVFYSFTRICINVAVNASSSMCNK